MKLGSLIFMLINCLSCSSAQENSLKLGDIYPEKIEITNIETNEKKVITDTNQINTLISSLINSRREIVKFKPKVKIEIFTQKETILLLYADGYLKYNGISYKVEKLLEF